MIIRIANYLQLSLTATYSNLLRHRRIYLSRGAWYRGEWYTAILGCTVGRYGGLSGSATGGLAAKVSPARSFLHLSGMD